VETFDAEAALADLDSPEARLLDGSFVVATNAGFLMNLYETFVPLN
jgi:hypothetical protein